MSGGAHRTKRSGSSRRRAARAVWGLLASGVVLAVLALFVIPVRTYFDQRHQLAVYSQHLRVIDTQNAELAQRISKLQTDAEIERLAREHYHLVRPGEQAFAILPAPSPTTIPAPAAPRPPASHHPGFWQRAWHRLTSWL